ncbi:hypothetical protein RYX36_011278, partial [Vicia faba]
FPLFGLRSPSSLLATTKYNLIHILVYSARNLETMVDVVSIYERIASLQLFHLRDTKCHHHVKTYKISLKEGCFAEDSLSHINLDYGSHSLIPVLPPLCGLLIIGGKEVTYCNADVLETILIEDSNTIAYGMVDPYGFSYLLGGHRGCLSLLLITHEKEKVTGLQIKHLGDTSIASSISCIGSKYGDSQVTSSESVRLVNSTDGSLAYECRAPSGWSYGVATANATQILLATKSNESVELIYLEIGDGVLQQILKAKMEYQVSCLDLTPSEKTPIIVI